MSYLQTATLQKKSPVSSISIADILISVPIVYWKWINVMI
jgi:hypothetical protein